MPSAIVKELEVTGVPCLVVVSTRPLAENEEITLDLGYQLEVREGTETEQGSTHLMSRSCQAGTRGPRGLLTLSTQERSGNTGVNL